ncbi:hypothetical protein HDK77DRAFT_451510 [Phyllosticta capitalensis]
MRFATLARSLFITLCFRLGTRLASSGRSTDSSLGFRLALEIISLVRGFVSLQNIPPIEPLGAFRTLEYPRILMRSHMPA